MSTPINLKSDLAALTVPGGWFASIPQALREALLTNAEIRTIAAGQRLFARGDAPDGIYCVLTGVVRVTGITENGQEAILAMLESPQWFGEIALFDNEPRTHDAWAESDAKLLRVSQRALEKMLSERPDDWRHFGRLLTQKLRSVFVAMEDIFLLPPTARLARRLLSMAKGYGAWTDHTSRVISISQEQLGLMLSLSRQTVNQSLRELEDAGSIHRHRGSIEMVDLRKLEALGR